MNNPNPAMESGATQAAEISGLGVVFHHNIVTLQGACIKNVTWIPDTLRVSQGQQSGQDPKISRDGDRWLIDVYCGRHKTSDLTVEFNAVNASQNHMWNPSASDRRPTELNFFVGVQVEFLVNETLREVVFYFAQGSNVLGNNWWIASSSMVSVPGKSRIVPVISPSGQVIQVLEISSSAANVFTVTPWFERSGKVRDYKEWLKDVNDNLSIGSVNLPGTHDSAAIVGWTSFNPYVNQALSLTKQMLSGVRLFDIRLKVKKDNSRFYFVTCHGDIKPYETANEFQSFISVLDEFTAYLFEHSTEFLVVSLKIDDWGGYRNDSGAVLQALRLCLAKYSPFIWISQDLPTVLRMRRKIFFLNRITSDMDFGVPISVPDNTEGQLIGPVSNRKFKYWIQDRYEDFPFIFPTTAKFKVWQNAVDQTNAVDMVLNFASATYLKLTKIMINGKVISYFGREPANKRKTRLGWSLFDFVSTTYPTLPYGDLDVIDLLISSNFSWSKYPQPFITNETKEDL